MRQNLCPFEFCFAGRMVVVSWSHVGRSCDVGRALDSCSCRMMFYCFMCETICNSNVPTAKQRLGDKGYKMMKARMYCLVS